MTQLPHPEYHVPSQYDQDQSNLNTLSIFYFILAGLQALGATIMILIGLLFVLGGIFGAANARDGEGGAILGTFLFFACFWIFVPLLIGTIAFLNFKVGRGLRARRSLTLIYIMAGLICLSFPLGTILGVFTFVVLGRPSVKSTFT